MQKNIPSLNGLRAISIVMVVAFHLHLHHYFNQQFYTNKFLVYAGLVAFNGPLGVNIFFIISGFLITSLLINEEIESGKISLKNFYIRRFIRIFPAYYFLLLVYFLLQSIGYVKLTSIDWFSSLTFTKQFFESAFTKQFFEDGREIIGHLWSLSIEEAFYLLWPILFIKKKDYIILISVSLIAIVVIARICQGSLPQLRIENTIFSRGDALLIGCLLAIKYNEIIAWIDHKKKYIYLVFPFIALVVILDHSVTRLYSRTPSNQALAIAKSFSYGLFGSVGLVTNVLAGIIILLSVRIHNYWFILLNSTFMNHIGKLSFSIYLWQQMFTCDINGLPKYSLPISMLALYLFACFSYYLIEKPFLKLKNRFSS